VVRKTTSPWSLLKSVANWHRRTVSCRVSRATIEFQKLVEFGTVPFEEPLARTAAGFWFVDRSFRAERSGLSLYSRMLPRAVDSLSCGGFDWPNGTGAGIVSQALATWQERKIVVDSQAHLHVLSVDRLGQPLEIEGRPLGFQFHQQL